MTTLSAMRTVMTMESTMEIKGMPGMPGYTLFRSERGDALTVTTDDWADMGRPTQITVAIEPGDQLNRPPAGVDPDQAEADMVAGFKGEPPAGGLVRDAGA